MKRIVCFLLTLVMLLGMLPMTAINASAAFSQLTISAKAANVLKEYVGFQKNAYQANGKWYIGYGSEISSDALYPNGISKEDALVLLRDHVSDVVDDKINEFTQKNEMVLTQNQHDALAMFSYSYGTGWITDKTHALYQAVITGKTGNAFINTIAQYYTARPGDDDFAGQMNRRLSEANVYLNNSYGFNKPGNYTYVILDFNGDEYLPASRVDGEIIAFDTNKPYTMAVVPTAPQAAPNDPDDFLGWYVYDGKSDGLIEGTAVTRLDSNVAGKCLIAKFDDNNGFGNAKYEINTNTLVSRYVFNTTYSRTDLVNYKNSMDELAKGELQNHTTFAVDSEAMVDGVKWIRGVGKDTKGNRLEGWVYMGELPEEDIVEEKPVATAKMKQQVDIREGSTSGKFDKDDIYSDIIGTIAKDVTVNIYEIKVVATETGNQKWGKVNVNGVIGWINLAYADVNETTGENDSPVGREGTIIREDEVNVRDNPGTTGTNVITKLAKGTKVKILKTQDLGNAQWGYVEWSGLKDGYTRGWVYMYYVEVKGLESSNPDGSTGSKDLIKYTGVVTSHINLNVRTGPGVNYAPNGASLPYGTKINIYETARANNNVKWGRIGDDRWVCLQYVKLTWVGETEDNNSTTTVTTQQGTVSVNTLDILKNYNSNAAKLGTLEKGDVVTILERNTEVTETGSRIWGRIVHEGVEGWINLAYVELKTVTSVSGSTGSTGSTGGTSSNANGASGVVYNCISVNIREAAGCTNAQITKLANGTAVKVYDQVTQDGAPWAKVTWETNGTTKTGWVCTTYVNMVAAGTTPNANGNTVTGTNSNTISATGTVNSNINLKVRSGAGLSYPDFASLAKGTQVTIYQQVTADGMIWGQINTTTGTGWICMSYVTVDNASFTGNGVMGTIARCAVAVNVRSAPGTGNALVGTIGVGKRVEVFETQVYGTGMWARVAQGWISMDYLLMDSELAPGTALDASQPTEAPTQPSEPAPTVNKDNEVKYTITGTVRIDASSEEAVTTTAGLVQLKVRNNASSNSTKVGAVNDGNSLNILAVKNNGVELWGRIDQYATAGWVNMAYVTYSVHGYVNTDEQPIYADPNTSSTVKGKLSVNKELTITKLTVNGETVYGWVEEGLNGWIPMGRIDKDPVEVIPTYKNALYGLGRSIPGVTNTALTAYNEPSGTEVKFYLNSGVTVYIDDIDRENGRLWGEVTDKADGSVTAWIDLAGVTYVVSGTTSGTLDVRNAKNDDNDDNIVNTVAGNVTLCELGFDGDGNLWGKITGKANDEAVLNGGYVMIRSFDSITYVTGVITK